MISSSARSGDGAAASRAPRAGRWSAPRPPWYQPRASCSGQRASSSASSCARSRSLDGEAPGGLQVAELGRQLVERVVAPSAVGTRSCRRSRSAAEVLGVRRPGGVAQVAARPRAARRRTRGSSRASRAAGPDSSSTLRTRLLSTSDARRSTTSTRPAARGAPPPPRRPRPAPTGTRTGAGRRRARRRRAGRSSTRSCSAASAAAPAGRGRRRAGRSRRLRSRSRSSSGENSRSRRGGELDRERQSVEPRADLGDGRGVVVVQPKPGRASRARSTKRRTARSRALGASGVTLGSGATAARRDSCSPRTRSASRLVTRP